MLNINSKRESGIELLKILSIFAIILCHTYTNFTLAEDYTNSGQLFFDIVSFSNIEYFSFQIIITFGYLCDIIFFVCTAWFLCDSKKHNNTKAINMIINTFILSVLFLVIYKFLGFNISLEETIKCLTPISNGTYWYITCYIMFYLLSPYLNIIIDNLSKKQHLSICLVIFIIYYVIDFLANSEFFYVNKLIMFAVMYFIISYIKKYHRDFCESLKLNIVLFIISTFIFYLIIFINYAIVPINLKWHVLYNPFFLMMAISLLNIFRKIKFSSKLINTLSALTLFAYIIHSNPLFVDNTIINLISKLLTNFGTNLIVIKVVAFALTLTVFSLLISYIYYLFTYKIVNKISNIIANLYDKFIRFIVKED